MMGFVIAGILATGLVTYGILRYIFDGGRRE